MKYGALFWGTLAIVISVVGDVQLGRVHAQATPESSVIVAGYIASWKDLTSVKLRAKQLSHLIYAFGSVSSAGLAQLADPCVDAGRCGSDLAPSSLAGNFSRLALLKHDNPHLRMIISLGGWNGSRYFSDVAATKSNRERFAQSIIEVFFKPYPGLFDGVDVDWEYPVAGGEEGNRHRADDKGNFVALMAEIRRGLDALSASDGRRYELTMAVSADPDTAMNLDLKGLAREVDWFGVMAYDYNAGMMAIGFNAPLFGANRISSDNGNVDNSIRYFLRTGVSPRKIVLGIPFYGRAYRDVVEDENGRARRGHPAEDWGGEDGIDYKDIFSRHPQGLGFERHWDQNAQVPWLSDPKQRIWISYDDPESLARKAAYARSHNLAGVMIWEVSGDDGNLLPAVSRELRGP